MDEQVQTQSETENPTQPLQGGNEPVADLENLRNNKQQQFLAKALASENALEANMGAIAADIFGMLRGLKQSMDANLEEIGDPQQRHQELVSGFSMYLRGAKQTERFCQMQGQFASGSRRTQAH